MISSGSIPHGPYRATKLWNEVVQLFEAGMPTKKHRQLLKSYDETFTSSEAITWLHSLLRANVNFGPQVSKDQTTQLLKKFLKNHVIEDIHGKWGDENLTDNGRLYRFPCKEVSRQPLASLSTNAQPGAQLSSKNNAKMFKSTPNLNTETNETSQSLDDVKSKSGTTLEVDLKDLWKSSLLSNLKRVLHLHNDDQDVIPQSSIHVDRIEHNATNTTSSGLVHVAFHDEMPCWVLSAMKCLANWPDSSNTGLPNYDGFEKDVFKAVLDYYRSLPAPLTTTGLFHVFSSVLVRCELLDNICCGTKHSLSVEENDLNLKDDLHLHRIQKNLIQAQMRHENLALRRQRSRRSRRLFHNNDDVDVGSRHIRQRHSNNRSRDPFWLNRHQSMHDISTLVEEGSGSRFRSEVTSYNNNSSLSLAPTSKNSGNLQKNFVTDALPDEEMLSSVENLLLNMSHTVREELEMELMLDTEEPFLYRTMCEQTDALDTKKQGSDEMREDEDGHAGKLLQFSHHDLQTDLSSLAPVPSDPPDNHSNPPDNHSNPPDNHSQPPINHSQPPVNHMETKTAFKVYNRMLNGGGEAFRSAPYSDYLKFKTSQPNITSNTSQHRMTSSHRRSDIVERREVPPFNTSSNCAPFKLSYVSAHAPNREDATARSSDLKRFGGLSRSHSSLRPQRPVSSSINRDYSLFRHNARNRDIVTCEPQSPLSAALDLARKQRIVTGSDVRLTPNSNADACGLDLIDEHSSVSDSQPTSSSHAHEAFQLCLLLLPPPNRRKLLLLLRLLSKMLSNPNLIAFDSHQSLRCLLTESFTSCIIRSSDDGVATSNDVTVDQEISNKKLAERVFSFMLDHASVIFTVPEKLKNDVEEKMERFKNKKIRDVSDVKRKRLSRQPTFCKQISNSEYTEHSQSTLRQSLSHLLQNITDDHNMTYKEKKKKLKQFQKSYPAIYKSHFPDSQAKHDERRQPLLGNALKKLRKFRL